MDVRAVDHRLTPEERASFETNGYLIVEDALDPDTTRRIVSRLDQLLGEAETNVDARTADGGAVHVSRDGPAVFFDNVVGSDQMFVDLVDHPRTFPKVWGLLGWNIYLHDGVAIVTRTSVQDAEGGQSGVATSFRWHRDGGLMNGMATDTPPPRLTLKVGFFLTDLSEPGRGNMWLVPGSHRRNGAPRGLGSEVPHGAIPLCVEPGTAVVFDRRTWHAATPNTSPGPRKALMYGYAERWIRPVQAMTFDHQWQRSDAVRRQLLGTAVDPYGCFFPTDEDVPLRVWLREHDPDAAA